MASTIARGNSARLTLALLLLITITPKAISYGSVATSPDAYSVDAPTIPASSITFSGVLSNTMTVNFTPGNGGQRLAVMKAGSAPGFVPADNNFYSGALGGGEQAVYSGSGTSFVLSQLAPNTKYYIKIYEFNAEDASAAYLIAGAPTANQTTLALPLVYVTTPANGAVNQNASLNITSRAVTGATVYTIEISESAAFDNATVKSGGRTLNFDLLQYNTLYYTRAKTNLRNDYGQVTTFTTRDAATLAMVSSPANNAVNVNTTLNISSANVLYASLYTIQLSETPDFSVVAFEASGPTRTLAFSGLKYNTVYYNRVLTNLTNTYGTVRSFATRIPESIAYVSSPANNAVNTNTALNISSQNVPGATSYTIQLSEDPDFTAVAFEGTGPTRTIAFSGLKYNTTYYNRVSTNLATEFGWVNNFTTRTPESISYVTSPANGASDSNTSLNISSNNVPGAASYTIQLSTDPDFSTVDFEGSGPTRTIAFAGLQYNTTYYNRVITDLASEFGQVNSFTTRSPESITYVTSPADGAIDRNTELNISSNIVPGATSYTIQLSELPDFSTIVLEATEPDRTIAFAGLSYNTTYYTRVSTDLSPEFGAVKSFTTRTAESITYVASPADGAINVNNSLNISSSNVPGATTYTIQLSELPDFSTVDFEGSGPTRTISFPGLKYNTTYYNRVITNLASVFGPVNSFTTETAESITYVTSPANGAVDVNTSLNISSSNVPGATLYTIQLSEFPDFSTVAFEGSGATRTIAFAGLKHNTTYYNRVSTNQSPGFGAVRNFTTHTAESITYVTNPADGANSRNTVLNISSSNVPGATLYTIQLSELPDFSVIAFEVSGPTRTLAFSGLKYNTMYYNRVLTNLTEVYGGVRMFITRTAESIAYVTTPANNAVNTNTILNVSSQSVPGAGSYTIQLSEDPDFTLVAFEVTGATRTLAFSGLKYNTTYYNRVSTDVSTEFGWVNNFTTRTAESISYVTSPANGSIDINTTLNISSYDVPSATLYTIQLSEDPDFSAVDFESSGPTRTLPFAGLKYNTTYYDRVITDLSTEPGQVNSFTTRSPESITYVTSPTDEAIDRNTVLSVSSNIVPGATSYTIQLSESSDFSTVAFEATEPDHTIEFVGLKYNTTYYNRVSTDLSAEFGAMKSFTTRTAQSITYVASPADGAVNVNTSLNISSSKVSGATSYTIQLSESPDFATVDFEGTDATRTIAFAGLKYNTTYYNRVFTDLSEEFGPVNSFTTETAESITYVSSPANGAIDRNTTLNISSTDVAGATQYTIQLSEFADFAIVAFESTAVSRTIEFSGLQYNTTYYSRVLTDLSPGYGPVKSFATRTAESITFVTSPADFSVNINTVLNISSSNVPDATFYTIQLSKQSDFSVIAFEVSGSTRTLAFTGLEYNTVYYNRVLTNLTETYGAVRSFTTRSAESISYVTAPNNNAINANTNLHVSSKNVPGATTYTIQLSLDPDFTAVAFEATGPTRTLAFSGLEYNTTYYNRVLTNVSTEFGWVNNFTTRTAESISYVVSPPNGSIDRNTTLNISSRNVPGATAYTIQVSEDPDFMSIVFEGTASTRTIAFAGLSYNTTYYNRVATDLSPEYGLVNSFTTRSPESITYVSSPVNGAIDRNTTLYISSKNVPGATQYTIQLSELPDFSTIAFEGTGPSRTMLFADLAYSTTYYARVQTNLTAVYGQARSFTTRTPASITYVTDPADGEENVAISPQITANTVPGATEYTIQLSTLPDFSIIDFELAGETVTQHFVGLEKNTTYYNRVFTDLSEQPGPVRSFTTAGPGQGRISSPVASESESSAPVEFNVQLYPNPFREKLSVYVESDDNDAEINLRDMTGRSVHLSNEQTNKLIEINKPLSAGVYLLQIRTAHHNKVVRVVKVD